MSKQTTQELQEACNRILHRVQAHRTDSFPCPLCGIYVANGEDKLVDHLCREHGAHVHHFNDVVDFDGFLACLSQRVRREDMLRCPVCLESVGTVSAVGALKAHLQKSGHDQWTPATIPELAPFCLPVNFGAAAASGVATSDEDEYISGSGHRGHNDEDPDGTEEEGLDSDADDWGDCCVCLYCPEASRECLGHMTSAHRFNLPAATRSRCDVDDEYDVIRLINAVRRCVAEGKCPYAYLSADTTSCALEGTLEEHLMQCPEHRLPKIVPRESDAELIPFLPGDALLSLVVTAGEGFLREQKEDPDFPMAPTLQQVVAHGIAQGKKEAPAGRARATE